ncbi:MAG TPA: Crp/Fnr family transcriptional regulator [Allosphingosinicella sp.]|jgi:CRP-like cAMP-binding protein
MRGNPLLARLEIFADLSDDEKVELAAICGDVRAFGTRQHIIRDDARPEHVHLIVDGWAARYKSLPDGSRQILAFLLPGDFCDLHVAVLGHMDHAIVALTKCKVAFIASRAMDVLTSNHNSLTKALWWGTLVDEAVLRSWVVNLGRRDARARIAHLLCELHLRMQQVGLASGDRFDMPLTQEELADATGLTSVHTNRTLQRLRAEGLIELQGRVLTLLDPGALRRAAGFDPGYLHIKRRQTAPI